MVNYHGHIVSDEAIRKVLDKISIITGRDLNVTSGDRTTVPRGGARHSDHLLGRAADFHIQGLSDEEAFAQLRTGRKNIFGESMTFQVIRHGPNTQTQGAHIHLGEPPSGSLRTGFWTEGLNPASRGHYHKID